MSAEIERKFLVREVPDLNGIVPVSYERYFLASTDGSEERVQKKGEAFEWEKKVAVSDLASKKEKRIISKEEFEVYKTKAVSGIERESYLLSLSPEITLKVYHGSYEGLVRAEVEFENEAEAKSYRPESWMGEEITNSPLGRDSKLTQLSKQEFQRMLGHKNTTE